jgi:hypothetical protein
MVASPLVKLAGFGASPEPARPRRGAARRSFKTPRAWSPVCRRRHGMNGERRLRVAAATVLLLVVDTRSLLAQARPTFLDLSGALGESDAVAIIQIEASEQVVDWSVMKGIEKEYETYGQRNVFRFVKFIKRAPFIDSSIESSQILWAGSAFHCASVWVHPGRYLAFLHEVEPGEWVIFNHFLGALEIERDEFERSQMIYQDDRGLPMTLDSVIRAVQKATALRGRVEVEAEIVGSFRGGYNRWVSSWSHQTLVFHVASRNPSPWLGPYLFARAFIPPGLAGREEYESWTERDGRLAITGDWIGGSLVVRAVRRLAPK